MNREELQSKLESFLTNERLDEKSKKTIVEYRNAINKLISFLPEKDIEITKDKMIDFKNSLNKLGFAVKSKNKYIIIVNKFLKYIGYNDCILKKFKEQQKTSVDDPIWEQEHKRMLHWAKKLGYDDMYLILKIFAYTGIRVAELENFTVENINKNYIAVNNKGKTRDIILRNDLLREIKHYCKSKKIESGYIFVSPEIPDKMLNPSTIWRRLKRIAGAAKINQQKIHPHAWRHLFAKAFMAIPGNNLDELADILGHSKIETTRLYTMTSKVEKKKKLEKIKY